MRYILSLLLIISSYVNAQTWQPTSIRQRFVNGIGIPTRDTVSGTLADSSQLVLRPQDSVIYFKYKGSWRKVGSAATTSIPWDSVSGKPLNFPTTYALSNDVRDSIQARLRKTDTAAMLAPYLRKIDTTNAFLISVSQPNDTTLTFLKGNTYSSYVLRAGTASAATKLITSVYNNSGSTILKGSVVYINGAHSSNLPTIALAIASQELTSAYTYGLVESDIPNNNAGIVVQNGNLTGLNLPTSTYTDGQTLYLSATVPGGYSLIKPTAPNHYTAIGTITRAHPVNGTIQVAIRNGFQLDELSDVLIPPVPNDSALLQFSRVDSLWHQVNPTTAMGNRFIKPSDTAAMLTPYLRANVASATYEPKITPGTTAQYWRGDKSWQTLNTTAVPEGSNLYYQDVRARAAISLTTTGTSGAATYNSLTGVLNVPQYPGTNGTVTSIATTAPLTGGTITTTGTLGITQATTSTNGFLSSTDWNTFNNKQAALTNPITGTGTTNYLPKFTGTSTIGNSQVFDDGTNVGIGTNAPTSKLTVLGDAIRYAPVSLASGNAVLVIKDDGSNGTLDIASEILGDANAASNPITFRVSNASAGRFEAMRISNTGNLGLGVNPSAWDGTLVKAIQLADNGASLSSFSTGNTSGKFSILSNNAYYDATGWKYAQNGFSSQYRIANAEHQWYTALSGTQGNAITFTQAMTLNANGNLGIGTTSPAELLSVQGKLLVNTNTTDGANALQVNGSAKITSLAGTGERNVAVDANGKLIVSTTAATVASGTYTPTATFPTNATSIGIYTSPYTQIGNVVSMTVSGYFTPTAANTYTKFNLTIPVAAISVGSAILYGTGNISNAGATVNAAARVTATTGSVLGFLIESYPTTSGNVNYFSASIQYTLQ